MPYLIVLLLIAASTELMAFLGHWPSVRWPAAAGIDLGVILAATVVTHPGGLPPGYAPIDADDVVLVGLCLPVLLLLSVAARALRRPPNHSGTANSDLGIVPFDIVQGLAAVLVGFAQAATLVTLAPSALVTCGVVALGLGAASYAMAFASPVRREPRSWGHVYFAVGSLVLTLIGGAMLFGVGGQLLLWLPLACVTTWFGRRLDRLSLSFHGISYLLGAALSSSLLRSSADGLLGGVAGPWARPSLEALASFAALALCYGLLVTPILPRPRSWVELLPPMAAIIVLGWAFWGFVAAKLAAGLDVAPGPHGDSAYLATIRTGIAAVVAIGLAGAGRHWQRRELLWLVYPMLVVGGIKLVADDFRTGRPITLFLSFALYGTALLAAPRLAKGAKSEARV